MRDGSLVTICPAYTYIPVQLTLALKNNLLLMPQETNDKVSNTVGASVMVRIRLAVPQQLHTAKQVSNNIF